MANMNKQNSRSNQANLWVDKDFLVWLKKLKAKNQIEGIEIPNLGELTRQILQTDAIKEVERQIISHFTQKDKNDIKLKLDERRIFK